MQTCTIPFLKKEREEVDASRVYADYKSETRERADGRSSNRTKASELVNL
jgi:hypothetical protein